MAKQDLKVVLVTPQKLQFETVDGDPVLAFDLSGDQVRVATVEVAKDGKRTEKFR